MSEVLWDRAFRIKGGGRGVKLEFKIGFKAVKIRIRIRTLRAADVTL